MTRRKAEPLKPASRMDPNAPERPMAVVDRDLDRLFRFFVHGPLRNSDVQKLDEVQVTQRQVSERLKRMSRQANGYLHRPKQQWKRVDALSQSIVHDITPKGVDLLVRRGRITPEMARWHEGLNDNKRQYDHRVMEAFLSASYELGCRENGWRFVPWTEIVAKSPESVRSQKNPLAIRFKVDGEWHTHDSDKMYGAENAEGQRVYVFPEAHTNSEPLAPADVKRSSVARHVWAYRHIFGSSLYHRHFGIPEDSALVLFASASETNARNIVSYIEKAAGDRKRGLSDADPFYVTAVPEFHEDAERRPALTGTILARPYMRAGEPMALLHQ